MFLSYNDSEINCFHPICELALNRALQLLGREKQYQVLHHQYTGALEMDFVIQNRVSRKYLCVVEVKRTPNDVHSTRYQFQAMSYVQMNSEQSERPFYILTNLEYAFSFRYDETKPKVFQQMLQPGLHHIGSFASDSREEFIEKLALFFSKRLDEYINDSYEYLVTLEDFASHMEQLKDEPRKWKSHLAVLLYEYIRGAFTFIDRNELRDIRLFRNNVGRICNEAAQVNFKEIFNYSDALFEPTVNIPSSALSSIFTFGNQNINGDTVADILHSIVSSGHEHDGEVPTDYELARLVAVLAKYGSGQLEEQDRVCDPAAGSGNLISAAIPVYDLYPSQILANDINGKLLELLSLRLGLNFASIISSNNSPSIHNKNLTDIDPDFFSTVKVVVMNPPFVAGINCVDRKRPFYERIRALSSNAAKTSIGQMPLEAVFLELLLELVQSGTTISCVFPKTHLMGRGLESKEIRRLLLKQFGLQLVFTYPGDGIFDEVTKDTCILLGKAKCPAENIKLVSSYENIPDIDIHHFSQALLRDADDAFRTVIPGIAMGKLSRQALEATLEDGWRMLNSELMDAIVFVNDVFRSNERFIELSECDFDIKRGRAGNSGGSDLIFFDTLPELYGQFSGRPSLSPGMRNARLDSFNVGLGNSAFLDAANNEGQLIDEIISAYIALPARVGWQARRRKTAAEWKELVLQESKGIFPAGSILIPRGIRTTGRVYFSEYPVFVSTNFVVCSPENPDEALVLASWMSTVFYQLICEVSAKDQEGMRKMEVADIKKTLVPRFSLLSADDIAAIKEASRGLSFLSLRESQLREPDRIWAEILFGEKAEALLNSSKKLLDYLANRRYPQN